MIALIILNIILIFLLVFLLIYIFESKNKKENVSIKNDTYDKIEKVEYKKTKPYKIFDGKFVSDEEYHNMMKNRRSDISILLEEFNREYEHLKELNK
jgi:type III secretory pathway component EscR